MSQPCDWQCVAGAEPPQFVCRRCGLQTVIRTAGDAQAVLERYPPCGVLVAQIHKQQSETPPPPGLPRRLRSDSRAVARGSPPGVPNAVTRRSSGSSSPCASRVKRSTPSKGPAASAAAASGKAAPRW